MGLCFIFLRLPLVGFAPESILLFCHRIWGNRCCRSSSRVATNPVNTEIAQRLRAVLSTQADRTKELSLVAGDEASASNDDSVGIPEPHAPYWTSARPGVGATAPFVAFGIWQPADLADPGIHVEVDASGTEPDTLSYPQQGTSLLVAKACSGFPVRHTECAGKLIDLFRPLQGKIS